MRFAAAVACLAVSAAASAQKYQNGLIDKTVAVVGNEVIMLSDIEEEVKTQNYAGYMSDKTGRCELLENMMVSKLFLMQARVDSLTVNNDMDDGIHHYFERLGTDGEVYVTVDSNRGGGYIEVKPNTSTRAADVVIPIIGWKNSEMVALVPLDVRQEGKPEEEAPKDGSITSTSITIDESAQDVTINVSQTNMASWDVVELEQGSNYASIGEYDFSTSTIVLEVNQNYTQAIREIVVHISGTDLEGNTKEGWITVEQEATSIEEDPYIALSNNNILIKDVDETKDVEVTYGNIDNINTPTVPEGYEIEEVSRTENGDETKVIYRIRKTAANKGDVTLNFSGDDTTSEDLTIKGWAPPTTPATITYTEYSFDYEGRLVFDYTGGTKGFTMIINGYTKPMDVSFTLTDPDGKLTCTQNELQYDDGYDYATWAWEFAAEANSSSSSYDGTINITYEDGLTDYSHSIPFHIRHANEGQILRGSNDYRYDKDGELLSLYDYIGISIVNITTLNTPTHPDWITIGEGVKQEGVFYGIDARYNYPISVSANEGASRTGIVVFSGIGKDGETYSVEVTVHQEGDDTEKPIDEGFIELQSLSLVFPSSGGTDTFQVKYYDAQTIYMPELGGDWATITEIGSSEEEGVAWNGTECIVTTKTYQVVAEASDSGREMKVLCKLLSNSNTYFEKDKFVIQQLAPDSSELQGRVVVLRYSKTYSYYGSAIGFPPKVGYKGLTVGVPEFSETWVRLGDVSMKTDTEYDYIYEYSLDMDVNNTPFSRSCTITFRGQGADGTLVKATITITQEGQEEIVNEGEYDNYRGYFMDFEGDVHSISFITNPRSEAYGDIRLAGDSPVVVSYSETKRLWNPVRTSTCTVKVVSSQYLMNLYSGHAHGTQVILKNDTKDITEWVGFMQPNLYNQGFTECMEEIEFEASDTISSLQYFNYEPHYINGKMTVTFHDIITDIMDKCTLINSFYLTEKTYSDSFQSKPMLFSNFYISEENFYSEEGEPWKMSEVLEEICKYMGLVCFQYNDSVYFMDFDKYKAAGTLSGYKYSKSGNDWEREYVLIADSPNSITEESYRNTGADISLDDVFNKVTVKCSYYNFEDVLPDIFDDDKLVNRFGDGAITSISRYGGRENSVLMNKTYYRVYDHVDIDSLYYIPVKSPSSSHETKATPTEADFEDRYFFRKYVGGNIVDMVHLNYNEANGGVGESKEFDRYLMISQLNRPWCGSEGTFHWENYNFPIMEFKNIPVLFVDNTAVENEKLPTYNGIGFGSSSSTPHNRLPKVFQAVPNYLVIKAEAIFVADLNGEYYEGVSAELDYKKSKGYYEYGGKVIDQLRNTPALCFYLEIPQKGWWDGSGWVDYKTHFEVPLESFGEDDWWKSVWGTSKNVKNNVETRLFLGTTGYRIPLPKEMTTTQDIYFAIAMPKRFAHLADIDGGDYTGTLGNAYCFIKDLSMNIINRNTAMYEDEDVIYENVIDEGNVIEGEEIEVKITSDRYNGLSFSNVSTVTAENKNTTDIHFYANGMRLLKPEECIIERYVNQYSTPSIKENVTLDMSFKPYQRITDTYWDKDFVITAQDIDYQMCRQKLTLLEKKKADGKYVYEGYTVPAEGRSNYRRRTN